MFTRDSPRACNHGRPRSNQSAVKVGTLSQLYRYPVKSMAGEAPGRVTLLEGGIAGDRCWAVRDETNGGIRGAKKFPRLMQIAARFPGSVRETSPPAELSFPDGSRALTTDLDIHERLSDFLGHEVSLWPLLPAEEKDHYRRGAPGHDDMETELRAIFSRTPEEPLPNLGLFPPEIFEFESPPGTYFDAFPLLLLSEASLASMQQRATDSRFDVRRFRPNFVIADTPGGAAFPEMEWRDERVRVGDAVLKVTVECPRCVMVTHAFGDLPKDPYVIRALVREAEGNLGVYARVEEPGTVRIGDTLELLS